MEPDGASWIGLGSNVTVNVPDRGTVTVIGTIPATCGPTGRTTSENVPFEPAYEVLVGMNSADRCSLPAAANVVVMLATPLAFTAIGAPTSASSTSNCTCPATCAPPDVLSVAVSVTLAPAVAGLGAATSLVVVGRRRGRCGLQPLEHRG